MSVFAELGLREDAEEPDIKRAYARRLRTVRPDEDAEGFQALNAAYKAALAAARWRAQAAADAELLPDEVAPAEAPTPDAPEPREAPVVVEPADVAETRDVPEPAEVAEPAPLESHPIEVPDDLFDYATARDEGGIAFDFDAFSRDLLAITADPEADLRAWLAARMAAWPIAMKPTLAPYLLAALDDEDVAVSPEHFEILTAAFGLDDVLSGIDAVAIAQLRAANERRWARHEAVTRAQRLLAPGNRRALSKAVRIGGYPPLVAPLLARLVTGRGAAYRTGLRWLPLVARRVLTLLRYVSANNVDSLSPPIDPKVLAKWQFADRTIGKMNVGHWVVLPFVVLLFAGFLQNMWEAGTRHTFAAATQEEQSDPEQAVSDYSDFIKAAPQPWSDDKAVNVAIALFNRGIVLSRLDRVDEAMRSYRDLDGTFADYKIPLVRLQVAKGLVNLSFLSIQRGDFVGAIDYARKVTARYSGANDEELGEDGFDLQVVKALNDQADASDRLGGRLAARTICESVLDHFKDAKGAAMKLALGVTRDIENEAVTGANSPAAPTPAAPPIEKFVPAPKQMPPIGVPRHLVQ